LTTHGRLSTTFIADLSGLLNATSGIIMNLITFRGDTSQRGAYLLWMHAREETAVSFGRFHGGRPVVVAPGWYAYVGSAMGRSGATALAGRLLRHATRAGGRPPHAIREAMMRAFAAAGLGNRPLRPPPLKRLHWHVDYLLDESAVELEQVIVIRAEARLESALARQLAALPGASPLLPGLGAADTPGETHLLRVEDIVRTRQRIGDILATVIDPYIGDLHYNRP